MRLLDAFTPDEFDGERFLALREAVLAACERLGFDVTTIKCVEQRAVGGAEPTIRFTIKQGPIPAKNDTE